MTTHNQAANQNAPDQHAALHAFREALRGDLQLRLPGAAIQNRMAPLPLTGASFRGEPGADARQGGVLVLLYSHEGTLYMPLILRQTYRGVHSGQVGFPGGGREPADLDLTATALREAYEEIGVSPARVEILGWLSPLFVFASNYLVQPVVGWHEGKPDFRTDPYEVAQLLATPVADLLDAANLRRETWTLRGREVEVPYYGVSQQMVWGATAMMLSEFLALPAMAQLSPPVHPPS